MGELNHRPTPSVSSFIATISYTPAPSRPLPLPLPRPYPAELASSFSMVAEAAASKSLSATTAPAVVDAPTPPKLIGRSSRHWHAQTPMLVISSADAAITAHHSICDGSACVY